MAGPWPQRADSGQGQVTFWPSSWELVFTALCPGLVPLPKDP